MFQFDFDRSIEKRILYEGVERDIEDGMNLELSAGTAAIVNWHVELRAEGGSWNVIFKRECSTSFIARSLSLAED